MPELIEQGAAAAVAALQAMVRQVVREEIATALRNTRPGGLVPVAVTFGAASLTSPGAIIPISFPAALVQGEIHSATAGTAVVDVKIQLPGQARAAALSLFDASGSGSPTYLSQASGTDTVQLPTANWYRDIPAGSTLIYYLRSGTAGGVTGTLILRALAG